MEIQQQKQKKAFTKYERYTGSSIMKQISYLGATVRGSSVIVTIILVHVCPCGY